MPLPDCDDYQLSVTDVTQLQPLLQPGCFVPCVCVFVCPLLHAYVLPHCTHKRACPASCPTPSRSLVAIWWSSWQWQVGTSSLASFSFLFRSASWETCATTAVFDSFCRLLVSLSFLTFPLFLSSLVGGAALGNLSREIFLFVCSRCHLLSSELLFLLGAWRRLLPLGNDFFFLFFFFPLCENSRFQVWRQKCVFMRYGTCFPSWPFFFFLGKLFGDLLQQLVNEGIPGTLTEYAAPFCSQQWHCCSLSFLWAMFFDLMAMSLTNPFLFFTLWPCGTMHIGHSLEPRVFEVFIKGHTVNCRFHQHASSFRQRG